MMNHQDKIKLSELIIMAFDGQITDHQRQELNEIVGGSSDAAAWYLEFVDMLSCFSNYGTTDVAALDGQCQENSSCDCCNVDLNLWQAIAACEKDAPAVEIQKEEIAEEIELVIHPPRKKRPPGKFQIFTLVVSAAAVIFFALFIKFIPEPLPSVEVATLVDQMNVQWADPAVDFENGSRLWTNDYPIDLKKGLVSITYDQGVEVVVEGPALFEIERSGIFLEYGRLYSQVSETGIGFTVNTSTSQFVDMGTEFGVKAEIDGSSELHVTRGKVQLFAGAKGKSRTGQMVTENMAARFNALSGQIQGIGIKKNAFVRKISSAFNHIWTGPSPYERAVQKTKPLYYWRFDWDQDGLLRNEMDSSLNDEYKLFGSFNYIDGPNLGGGKNVALRLTGRDEDYAVLRSQCGFVPRKMAPHLQRETSSCVSEA